VGPDHGRLISQIFSALPTQLPRNGRPPGRPLSLVVEVPES
jgi:hypothetical protein